jgi:exopolysaccharide production protein ExoQ
MHPTVALMLWLVMLLALLRFDPGRESEISRALWVPVFWFFISQSRLPSQWLGTNVGTYASALEEGNPYDRVILFGLILLSVVILLKRSFQWGEFFSRNFFLTAFLLFGLVSFLWSDFPSIALKRWIRDLGNYLAILVVLTDPHPLQALRTFSRRLYFVLIPLSILMIKYYTVKAINYDFWTGLPEYVGAATSKNTLGATCLLSGIFFFWDTAARWSEKRQTQAKRIIAINIAFIMMSLYVLRMSNSATSKACLFLGWAVILACHFWKQRPATIKALIPVFLCSYVILAYGFGLNDFVARSLGRDPSLTGRTNIWQIVLSVDFNRLLGTGYETFWLGDRLYQIWGMAGGVTQAHNGYLEIYLNFGIVGIFILAGILISGYRTICRGFTQLSILSPLVLAAWTLALFYNITEAAFKPPFMCLTFLVGTIVIPERRKELQRLVHSRVLPRVDKARMAPKWAEVNRLRAVRKSDHD